MKFTEVIKFDNKKIFLSLKMYVIKKSLNKKFKNKVFKGFKVKIIL